MRVIERRLRRLERILAGRGRDNIVPALRQGLPQVVKHLFVVVDYQDIRRLIQNAICLFPSHKPAITTATVSSRSLV
jgi:hypothetical protein